MIEGNDGGAHVSFNGGALVVDDLQPEDRAVLSHRHRQPVSLPRLRHAAGQHLDLGAQRVGMGRDHAGRLLLSRHRRERASSPSIRATTTSSMSAPSARSPGGAGALQRYDHRTRQIQLVNVWPEESTGIAPEDLKYRFAWTFPIVFSPHDPGTLYAGGNCVFRTRDEGMSWERISPDLSLNDRSRQGASGGQITRESAGAEVHATCACGRRIAASPAARSGPRPTTAWCMSRATTARAGRTSRPRACRSSPMSAASRSRRTTPTRSMSPPPATSSPTTSPTCSGAPTAAGAGSRSTATCPKDEITRVVRADPVGQGPAVRRHRDRHPFQRSTTARTWQRMTGLPDDAGLRPQAQGRRPGRGDARPLVLDPGRRQRRCAALADGTPHDRPGRAAHDHPHQAALERRRQRAHRHRLRPRLRHRRQHGHGRAARRHAGARASRCRREPAERRDRLVLAGAGGEGRRHPHLPRFGRAQDHRLLEHRQGRAAGAQARHQGRPQPLRLGHALSRPEQDRLFAGAGPAQAAGARSREPARPDRGARHLRRRSRGRRQDPVGQVHRGQGSAPADHAGAVRRAVRAAQAAGRVALQAQGGAQPAAPHEAPAGRGRGAHGEVRARAAQSRQRHRRRSSTPSRR